MVAKAASTLAITLLANHAAEVTSDADWSLAVQEMKPRDRVQYFRCSGVDGLEVMSACWVEHSFAPHMPDFYAVSLNYRGRGAFDCRGELRDAAPGTCNLIAPEEVHTGHATSRWGWAYRNLYIEPALIESLLNNLEWEGPSDVRFRVPLVRDPVLTARLARAFASLTNPSSLLENESSLLSVVARLVTDHFVLGHNLRETGREHAAVLRVRDWLHGHSEQNVSIHSLAEIAGLSPYYLVRAFHKHIGMPPHKYQTTIRVNRARQLLKSGEPIAQVTCRTGFFDQSHLNRCFKKTLGVTPGTYAGFRPKARVTESV
jgi:AraC-like DNA-binding protein